jgi:hypothetical protein
VRKIYATCLSEVFKRAWFELFKSRLLRMPSPLSGVNKTQSDWSGGAIGIGSVAPDLIKKRGRYLFL